MVDTIVSDLIEGIEFWVSKKGKPPLARLGEPTLRSWLFLIYDTAHSQIVTHHYIPGTDRIQLMGK